MFQFLRMTKVSLLEWRNETLLDLWMGVIGTLQTVVGGKTDVSNLQSSKYLIDIFSNFGNQLKQIRQGRGKDKMKKP